MRAAAQPFPESGLRIVGYFGPQSAWMSIAISTSSPHQSVGGRERESLYSSPVESSRVQSRKILVSEVTASGRLLRKQRSRQLERLRLPERFRLGTEITHCQTDTGGIT